VIPAPGARRWSPGDPFLHLLSTSTGGDGVETHFGMREFRYHAATGRAYLNDEPCFLRGSNVDFQEFLETPKRARLPWDRTFVRRLLVEVPKRLNWNFLRFSGGPAPDFWYGLADEAGLLVEDELQIESSRPIEPVSAPFELSILERMPAAAYGGSVDGSEYFMAAVGRNLVTKDAAPEARREEAPYLLGALIEHRRARREAAGVLYFYYLAAGSPENGACDAFLDIEKLSLEPRFEDSARNAFSPVGVCLDFWRQKVAPGSELLVPVVVVNDLRSVEAGKITISFLAPGGEGPPLAEASREFSVPPFGKATYRLAIHSPVQVGQVLLRAKLERSSGGDPVVSQRKLEVKS
jgi:hypothetical protein